MTPDLAGKRFVVVDVEGNGQQPPEIVEFAAVHLDGLTITSDTRTWLIRPSRPITGLVRRKVHGISNNDVAGAPTVSDLAPTLLDALGDRVPIAHNAVVERAVLRTELPAWRPPTMLDTMRLAKRVWPGRSSYGLDALLSHAEIIVEERHGQRHRAGYDAYATALLFVRLVESADDDIDLFEVAGLPGSTKTTAPADPSEGTLW